MTDSTADDPVVPNPTWTGNIKAFFTPDEVDCMKPMGIDLSSFESVKENAQAIHDETASGDMPQGGPPWSANRVQSFIATGSGCSGAGRSMPGRPTSRASRPG